MTHEELINKMVEEIFSIEKDTDASSLKDTKVTDFIQNDDNSKNIIKETKIKHIENIVGSLAEKFDLTNSKTYFGVKEIALAQLLARELYKKAMSSLRDEKNKKGANSTIYSEYRKTAQFILKLLKDVYVAPKSQEFNVPSREELFGENSKYILIDEATSKCDVSQK